MKPEPCLSLNHVDQVPENSDQASSPSQSGLDRSGVGSDIETPGDHAHPVKQSGTLPRSLSDSVRDSQSRRSPGFGPAQGFSRDQLRKLVKDVDAKHVRSRELDGKRLTYIEGWYAIAQANAIFGHAGWDREMVHFERVMERTRSDAIVTCGYMARVRIRVRAGSTEVIREGTGWGSAAASTATAANERALKAAETDATKRALSTFGASFGLSLYDKDHVPIKPRPLFTLFTPDGQALADGLSAEAYSTGLRQLIEACKDTHQVDQLSRHNRASLTDLRIQVPALRNVQGVHFADLLLRLMQRRRERFSMEHLGSSSTDRPGNETKSDSGEHDGGTVGVTLAPQATVSGAVRQSITADAQTIPSGADTRSISAGTSAGSDLSAVVGATDTANAGRAEDGIEDNPPLNAGLPITRADHQRRGPIRRPGETSRRHTDHSPRARTSYPFPARSEMVGRKLARTSDTAPTTTAPVTAKGISSAAGEDGRSASAPADPPSADEPEEVLPDPIGSYPESPAVPPTGTLDMPDQAPNSPSKIAFGLRIDKSKLLLGLERRIRDKAHLKRVADLPCLVCNRQPSHAHHLRFAQRRGLSQKVSDEYVVPLCALHHGDLHRSSSEQGWWAKQRIDPVPVSTELWLRHHRQ